MQVKATILVNGRPLRLAYVEHIVRGIGAAEMYITDREGRIEDTDGDRGIASWTPRADIRVICQNPIVRILDGNNLNIGVYQDRGGDHAITDGAIVNLDSNADQDDYFAILNRIQLAYEVAFRPLHFFQELDNPDFPLGRKTSLRESRDQVRRIDLIYPDKSVSPRPWVEPKRLGDDFPLMHIKDRAESGRLFGEDHDADGNRDAPTVLPHELAHALHFAHLSGSQRQRAQDKYLEFILTSPISGVGPEHRFGARTTAEVAYIEAGGLYGQRFVEFIRIQQGGTSTLVRPERITTSDQARFVATQWGRVTASRVPPEIRPPIQLGISDQSLSGVVLLNGFPIPLSRGLFRPRVRGGDVEGAVYAAIFVDFAARVGLDVAASAYFAANAISFGEYRTFINHEHPEHAVALEEVRDFWDL